MVSNAYLDRGSSLHLLDPRTKIVGFLILSALPFVFNSPIYVAAISLVVICLGALARSLENYLRVRHLLVLFLVVTFVAWQFYLAGTTVLARVGPLTLTREVLLYGLAAGIRVATVVMVGVLFVSTTKVEELLHGLVGLGMPYRVGFVIAMTARLVPTLALAVSTIVQAQVARGLDLDSRNPLRRARRLSPVVIPFLVYAVRHAALLSMALEARGFRPNERRSSYMELQMTARDYLVLVGLVATIMVCVVLRLKGYGAVLPRRI
jgi:energy-coupling factor transport system permease protein